jgi:potassium/hydrogen antiporter
VPRHRRAVLGFHEAMANAAEIGLFLLLGLLVSPSNLPAVALPALTVALVLILVARPVAVALCSLGAGLGWREQAVVSWGGPARGGADRARHLRLHRRQRVGRRSSTWCSSWCWSPWSSRAHAAALIRRLGLGTDAPAWAPVAEALPLDGIDVDLVELHVTEDLAIAGQRVRDLAGLETTLVAAVVRGNRVLIPKGQTRVLPGDVLLMTAQREGDVLSRLTAWARGEAPGGRRPPPTVSRGR